MSRQKRLPKPMPKHRTMIKLPLDVWNQGKQLAQRERRNFSNYIEVLLEREIQRARADA